MSRFVAVFNKLPRTAANQVAVIRRGYAIAIENGAFLRFGMDGETNISAQGASSFFICNSRLAEFEAEIMEVVKTEVRRFAEIRAAESTKNKAQMINELRAILRFTAVSEMVGLKRTEIYAKIKVGTFPAPIPLGERAVGWLRSEVEAWIQKQKSGRPVGLKTRRAA